MLGISLLGFVALSGPAVAFYDDSPILIPYLEQIQQALEKALGGTLREGFQKFAQSQINTQVERSSRELGAQMMPGTFCQADILQPVVTASIARASGYQESKNSFVVTGADTLVNGTAPAEALPSYNPNLIIAEHNREVRKYAQSAGCKPVQAVPVDVSGTQIQCTQEERRVAAAVLLGASPPAQLPGAAHVGALGEVYESARTTLIGRKQLAALALTDASSEQKQAAIAAYRAAFDKPTIDDLSKLSADGAASRDAVVLSQITARLLLENYVEQLEMKRLLAVYVAQHAEADDRKLLGPLRRSAGP